MRSIPPAGTPHVQSDIEFLFRSKRNKKKGKINARRVNWREMRLYAATRATYNQAPFARPTSPFTSLLSTTAISWKARSCLRWWLWPIHWPNDRIALVPRPHVVPRSQGPTLLLSSMIILSKKSKRWIFLRQKRSSYERGPKLCFNNIS